MSSISKGPPKSPVDCLTRQLSGMRVSESSGDIEERIAQYVQDLHAQKQQGEALPNVEYHGKKGCFVFCQTLCSAWSFCQTVTCCGTSYYYTKNINGEFVIDKGFGFRPPSADQNKLTNATFFLELYNTYGDYLASARKESIIYIQTTFPRHKVNYWKNWDPQSEDPLDPKRAKFFRGVIDDAATTLRELRKEAMRYQITHRVKTPNSAQGGNPSPVRFMAASSSPEGERLVKTSGLSVEFNREKIIRDIEELTLANHQQAEAIAQEVERELMFPCTGQDIWDAVRDKIIDKGIQSKGDLSSDLINEIAEAMKKDFYLKEQPQGFLNNAIAIRRHEKQKRERFNRAVQRVITIQGVLPVGTSSAQGTDWGARLERKIYEDTV